MITKCTFVLIACAFVLLFLVGMSMPPHPAHASADHTDFYVNSTADINDLINNSICEAQSAGSGICTLRAAISEANYCDDYPNDCGDYVLIHIPVGTFTLTIAGQNEDNNATGDLDINLTNVPIILEGAGVGKTIVNGNYLDRVLNTMYPNSDVTIRDLTIRGGHLTQTTDDWTLGAGIYHNNGTLFLENLVIEDNVITCNAVPSTVCYKSRGGGIAASGRLTIATTSIRNNTAVSGGGLFYNGSTSLKIYNTTISGNHATSTAGALLDFGSYTLLYNSTVSGNSAPNIGGIFSNSTDMQLNNVTIAYNSADSSPANLQNNGSNSILKLRNTIISNPIHSGGGAISNCDDSGSSWVTEGTNMSSDSSCKLAIAQGDFYPINPMLGPLLLQGGATQTHGLLPGSPAHDSKSNFCIDFDGLSVTIDQRGQNRNNKCDIGAFEGEAHLTFLPTIIR